MKPAALFFIACICTHAEVVLPAERLLDSVVLTQVYLNGDGPFRMMVDTGAAASTVRPEIARRIGARAQFRVERVTAAGSGLTPAGTVTVRTGPVVEENVEAIFSPVAAPDVDGVLGQSWLARHAYQIDFKKRRVILDGTQPAQGVPVALAESEGLPCIRAQVDGETHDLVIDSGASALACISHASCNQGPLPIA